VPDPDDFGLGLDVIPQDLPTWREHAHDALQRVSEKSIDSATKVGFDLAKKKVQKVGKQTQNDKADGAKAATMSYIDQLQLECDLGFERFKQNLLATASDAELVVVNRGFAPEYQSQGQYKAALAAKLARFKQSGVPEIGTQADAPGMFTAHSRRCAWLLDENGNKALWYITVQSGLNMNAWLYGRDLNIEKVPDEFVEAARAKSEEKWGETPTFEHPAVGLMRRMGLHEGGKQAAQRADAVAASEPSQSSLPRLDLGKSQPPSTKLQK
jgi:hypothetical protein